MGTVLLMLGSFVAFFIAYNSYGKFLAKKIFKINPNANVPSKTLEDGVDYVPCKRQVIFGHHFTSIAGTGPIVGPAIGIIWGWVPALIWILLGSIFMGAVHDFGSLVLSVRHEGKSISEIAEKYINKRVRLVFFCIVFLTLLIVIAIFGVIIAVVFKIFPSSILPVWGQIPIAMALGYAIYKRQAKVWLATAIAVFFMYALVLLGAVIQTQHPGILNIPDFAFMPATGSWTIVLLIYAFVASTLPVTTLLQPRDYTNAWQLFIIMAILIISVIATAFTGTLQIVAPAINTATANGAPPLWPFMFVTIACGAISGFHCLVASGTSPKQIAQKDDCLFIGYGSMLYEAALAILVLICVAAGIGLAYKTASGETLTGFSAWNHHYGSWQGLSGISAKLSAVVMGASNMMASIGIPLTVGKVLMGVFIASFAGTTLDTAVRLQRYIISELASDIKLKPLTNKWIATGFAVISAASLAFATGTDGKGAMTLWPLFGTVNQMLAALAFLVITIYLKRKGGLKYLFTALPCLFMLTVTFWSLVINLDVFMTNKKTLLVIIGSLMFALAIWITIEAIISLGRNTKEAK